MGGGAEPSAQASTALKPLFAANGPLGVATLTFPIPGVHEAIVTGAGKTVTATFSWNTLGGFRYRNSGGGTDYRADLED